MIFGPGIDIIEVKRIREAHRRWGIKFLKKILRPDEIKYCMKQRNPSPSIAARFAGKEAVSKAFGVGIGEDLKWCDMEIIHDEHNCPFLQLYGKSRKLFLELGGKSIHISLSHSNEHATAIAIFES